HVTGAVLGDDVLAAGGDGLLGDARAVGAHVRDQGDRALGPQLDAFVELLGDTHRPRGAEVQAQAALLLQRAGRERRRRLVLAVLLRHLADDVAGVLQDVDDAGGLRFAGRLELLALPFGQFRAERVLRQRLLLGRR